MSVAFLRKIAEAERRLPPLESRSWISTVEKFPKLISVILRRQAFAPLLAQLRCWDRLFSIADRLPSPAAGQSTRKSRPDRAGPSLWKHSLSDGRPLPCTALPRPPGGLSSGKGPPAPS